MSTVALKTILYTRLHITLLVQYLGGVPGGFI